MTKSEEMKMNIKKYIENRGLAYSTLLAGSAICVMGSVAALENSKGFYLAVFGVCLMIGSIFLIVVPIKEEKS